MSSLADRVAAARRNELSSVSTNRNEALTDLRGRLHFKVVEELGPTLYDRQMSDAELRLRVMEMLEWAIDQEQGVPLTMSDRRQLLNEIASDVLGYGPIDPLLNDPEVTEVMVNGPYDIRRAEGQDRQDRRSLRRRCASPTDHRQDRRPGRSPS